MREAALEMRVAPFYRNSWATAAQSFGALRTLLRSSRSVPGRLTIVLSPQNPDVVRAVGNAATVEANRRHLAAFLHAEAAGTRYEDWLARYAPALFLDHCHLTAEGNRRLAADLGSLLPPS